ncbi:MAG: nitrous oxide-stimulated promoter family protein [Lentisphaerae bacterium]|nr:nitrous oxide-stimulated promoter family protein [Lentisphaerota bacterium]
MMDATSSMFVNEKKTLRAMIGIYCHQRHRGEHALCAECAELLEYAEAKLSKCTFGEDKPKCSQCPVHCYMPAMREKIREVMKVAGPRMITKHPVLAVRHLVHGIGPKAPGRKGQTI